VFATAGSAEKCAACVKLGADRAINYKTEDFVAAVKEATAGRGVDVILDMVGGDYIDRELKCLADDGRIVIIAFLGGSKATLYLSDILRRRLTVTGSALRPRSGRSSRPAKSGRSSTRPSRSPRQRRRTS
jgi:NADPH2:quinone reductase